MMKTIWKQSLVKNRVKLLINLNKRWITREGAVVVLEMTSVVRRKLSCDPIRNHVLRVVVAIREVVVVVVVAAEVVVAVALSLDPAKKT
mgnify:CR=1 FL=1